MPSSSSFWTWKKASTRYPGLNVIVLTPSWKSFINYLAKGKKKPSREEALKGIQEFLSALSYNKLKKNEQMLKVLMTGKSSFCYHQEDIVNSQATYQSFPFSTFFTVPGLRELLYFAALP